MRLPRIVRHAPRFITASAILLLAACASASAPSTSAANSSDANPPPAGQSLPATPQLAALGSLPQEIAEAQSPDSADATDGSDATPTATPQEDLYADFPTFPLPDGNPPPLGPGSFGPAFREPLPPSPVWNPPGQKRVGLQVGHLFTDQVPPELARLSPGTSAGGWQEWQVNLMIAQATAAILEDNGVAVDILPTTVPIRYRAQVFVAIHADGDTSGALHGFKVTRSGFSSIPDTDDQLVSDLNDAYAADTGMPRDDAHISLRMTYYYAFNTRRYQHAIDLGTPAAIIEAGYLTNAGDRAQLTNHPEISAAGIADGILKFLSRDIGATS